MRLAIKPLLPASALKPRIAAAAAVGAGKLPRLPSK